MKGHHDFDKSYIWKLIKSGLHRDYVKLTANLNMLSTLNLIFIHMRLWTVMLQRTYMFDLLIHIQTCCTHWTYFLFI